MNRGPERVGEILSRVLKEAGLTGADTFRELDQAWREVAGEVAAEASRVVSFRKGVVLVEVTSAALRQELQIYRQEELLEGLRERVKSGFVERLRFRLV